MSWSVLAMIVFGYCVAPLLISYILTGLAIPQLVKFGLIDRPNARSSHKRPTPRGGGIVPVLVAVLGWGIYAIQQGQALGQPILFGQHWYSGLWPVLAGAIVLMVLGLLDDKRGLSPWLRLAVQLAVLVYIVGFHIAPGVYFFSVDVPNWLGRGILILLGLWFINLYNFMDGIDGITGTETISIMLGLVILGFLGVGNKFWLPAQLIIAASMLGFLAHNWFPARVFLGDAGSVAFGYIVFIMLLLSLLPSPLPPNHRYPLTVVAILPLYYLADSGMTLARRIWRRQNPMQAHKEHVYQQAVATGLSPAEICWRIAGINAALIAIAWISAGPAGAWATSLALIITGGFLWLLPQGKLH